MTRPAGAARRGLLIFVDQVLSSGSNFVCLLLIAGAVSTNDFGLFAIGFSVVTFALGLTRANLGVPLVTDLHRLAHGDAREFVGRTLAMAGLGSILFALPILALGHLLPATDQLRMGLLLTALFLPLLLAQDIGRQVAIAMGRPGRACLSDGAWLVLGVVGLLISLTGRHISPLLAIGVWMLGGAVALVFLLPELTWPVAKGTFAWFVGDPARRHLSWDALLGGGTPLLAATLVAALVSPAVVGSLRAAALLLTPVNVLVTAAGIGTVAEAVRRPPEEARRLVLRISFGLCIAAVIYGLVLVALPETWGVELLGVTWDSAQLVLPIMVIEFAALAVWTGAIALMRAERRASSALIGRAIYSVLILTTATTAALLLGTPRGVQSAFAASTVFVAALAWVMALRGGARRP